MSSYQFSNQEQLNRVESWKKKLLFLCNKWKGILIKIGLPNVIPFLKYWKENMKNYTNTTY